VELGIIGLGKMGGNLDCGSFLSFKVAITRMSMQLVDRSCVEYDEGTPPLPKEKAEEYLKQLSGWRLIGSARIEKNYDFTDFTEAMKFVNRVADIAEAEDHHPDILIHAWNKVRLTLSTHAVKGLSENDFILAAKIDQMVNKVI